MPRKRSTSKPSSCSPGTRRRGKKHCLASDGQILISVEGNSVSAKLWVIRDGQPSLFTSGSWHGCETPNGEPLDLTLWNGLGTVLAPFAKASMKQLHVPISA